MHARAPATGGRPSWRRAASAEGSRLRPMRREDLDPIDQDVRDHDDRERPEPRHAERNADRDEADGDAERRGRGLPARPGRPSSSSPRRCPFVWRTKSATRWASDQPGEDEDRDRRSRGRLGARARRIARCVDAAREQGCRGRRPAARSSGGGPDRRRPRSSPADMRVAPPPRIGAGLRPGAVARLSAGGASGHRGARPAAARGRRAARSIGRVACRETEAAAPGRRLRQQLARPKERRSGSLVAGPRPGSTSPATTTQRIGRRSGWSAARMTASRGSAGIASSPWISSPWVNSKSASRAAGGIRRLELLGERSEPGGRPARVAARPDDVAEQDDGVHSLQANSCTD